MPNGLACSFLCVLLATACTGVRLPALEASDPQDACFEDVRASSGQTNPTQVPLAFAHLEEFDAAPSTRSRRMTWYADSLNSDRAFPAFWTKVRHDSITMTSGALPEWNLGLARTRREWAGLATATSDAIVGRRSSVMRQQVRLVPRPCPVTQPPTPA
jgi:hypothetical protein